MKFNSESLYEHIGYLLYAMLSKYNKASVNDLNKLRDHIEKMWRPFDAKHVNLDLTDSIHDGVRYALENSLTTDQAVNSFKDYYMIHSSAFGSTLKEKIMESVKIISEGSLGPSAPEVTKEIQLLLV